MYTRVRVRVVVAKIESQLIMKYRRCVARDNFTRRASKTYVPFVCTINMRQHSRCVKFALYIYIYMYVYGGKEREYLKIKRYTDEYEKT